MKKLLFSILFLLAAATGVKAQHYCIIDSKYILEKMTDYKDAQVTVSNAKIYKNDDYMHFFSEQASIYQDPTEVVMIMPQQRMAIINSTTKELNNTKINGNNR